MKSFINFILGGVIGFITHGILFNLATLKLNNNLSYFLAFCIAVNITFIINKNFTFKYKNKNTIRVYILYILGQSKGFLINYFIFYTIMNHIVTNTTTNRNIAFFCASLITLFFNYFYAKKITFN